MALLADHAAELQHPMLHRLLHRSGLGQDSVYLGTASEPNLRGELSRLGVQVVMPLGERALRQTLGQSDIERWRGRVELLPHTPIWTLPTFQPSKLMPRRASDADADQDAMLRPPRFHGVWMRDLHRAVEIAQNGFTRRAVQYLVDPPASLFEQFADEYFAALAAEPLTKLSWDIETYYKLSRSEDTFEEDAELGAILRISFCFKAGYAVSVPWNPTYRPTIQRLLRSRGIHITWNGSTFDVPVVEADGMEVLGEVHDYMDGYHLMESDLPKGLEWVSAEATDLLPWKHLAQAEPGHYSCTDADAALRNADYIEAKLKSRGQWGLFINHVVRLMPLLAAAGKRGNKIDRAKRDEIRAKLTKMKNELIAEAQGYVPRQLRPRDIYKRMPKAPDGGLKTWPTEDRQTFEIHEPGTPTREFEIIQVKGMVKTCSVCGLPASNKTDHFKGSTAPGFDKKGNPKTIRVPNPCKVAKAEIVLKPALVEEYHEVLPFNPNSSDQIKSYMRHFGHPIGKDKRDSTKETADAKHLKYLKKRYHTKHPIYHLTLELHKAVKTIGTYTPEPDANDMLHTQYVNSTSTWRLGSRKVPFGTQIQNWGKREENKYAKEARGQIIARPDHRLVQIDSSAVEAVMQGFYMNDPDYMRLASKSIHAWLACRALGLEFTPDNVEKVKVDHESLYLKMKVTNYLTNFGGGAFLLKETFPEQFPSLEAAEAAQQSLYDLLPSLKSYHHSVRWEAHTKTFLTTPWGYRHWYYDVFKPGRNGEIIPGKDSKRCVAFKPQNSNAAFQRDNLVLMGCSPIDGNPITEMAVVERDWTILEREIASGNTWARFMPTNVSVHDSGCLDTPIALVERCADMQKAIFTRAIPEMRGLRIGAEVEVGENWGAMNRHSKIVVDDYTFEQTEAGLPLAA